MICISRLITAILIQALSSSTNLRRTSYICLKKLWKKSSSWKAPFRITIALRLWIWRRWNRRSSWLWWMSWAEEGTERTASLKRWNMCIDWSYFVRSLWFIGAFPFIVRRTLSSFSKDVRWTMWLLARLIFCWWFQFVEIARRGSGHLHQGSNHHKVTCNNDVFLSNLRIFYQSFQYFLIGLSEIFCSIVAVEFYYTQAPSLMKSVLFCVNHLSWFWLLARVRIGSPAT